MSPRPCIDCGTLTAGTRCTPCERSREAARGTRQQRGYDANHDAARRTFIAQLPLPCGYGCGRTLTTARDLVAAHVVDGQPQHGWIPSCVRCNQRARHRGESNL
jgi:hypothetical protein